MKTSKNNIVKTAAVCHMHFPDHKTKKPAEFGPGILRNTRMKIILRRGKKEIQVDPSAEQPGLNDD